MSTNETTYQTLNNVEDVLNDEREKVCRICLESDNENDMIAPCLCKGSSKWVHRSCLDQWRATNQESIAFSRCTECLFDFHMEPVGGGGAKRSKYLLLVSRDICLFTLALQIVIFVFGLFGYAIFGGQGLATEDCHGNIWCFIGIEYVLGFVSLLITLGIYGLSLCCINSCSYQQTMSHIDSHVPPLHSAQPTTTTTTQRRGRPPVADVLERDGGKSTIPVRQVGASGSTNNRNNNDGDLVCYDTCQFCCIGGDGRSSSSSGDTCCCEGCHCCHGSCTVGGGGGGSSSGDNGGGLVMVLAIIAIILAIIGFVVGVVIALIFIQRILNRHMFVLQKKRLVKEFRVKDLSNVDEIETGQVAAAVLPPPPPLPEEDTHYLRKLKLVDYNEV